MINIFDALQESESDRELQADYQLEVLSDDLKKYFSKKATMFGHACWIYYFSKKFTFLNFERAILLKDNKYPLIYIVSQDFKDLDSKIDDKNSYLSTLSFGQVKPMPDWTEVLASESESSRKKAKHIALNGLLKYNKGVVTEDGRELVNLLEKRCSFLGFIPHLSYVKVKSSVKDELHSIWVHPFGQRTLLYKIKSAPILVIANSSLELDDSALAKIDGNKNNPRLKKGTIGGITG